MLWLFLLWLSTGIRHCELCSLVVSLRSHATHVACPARSWLACPTHHRSNVDTLITISCEFSERIDAPPAVLAIQAQPEAPEQKDRCWCHQR